MTCSSNAFFKKKCFSNKQWISLITNLTTMLVIIVLCDGTLVAMICIFLIGCGCTIYIRARLLQICPLVKYTLCNKLYTNSNGQGNCTVIRTIYLDMFVLYIADLPNNFSKKGIYVHPKENISCWTKIANIYDSSTLNEPPRRTEKPVWVGTRPDIFVPEA